MDRRFQRGSGTYAFHSQQRRESSGEDDDAHVLRNCSRVLQVREGLLGHDHAPRHAQLLGMSIRVPLPSIFNCFYYPLQNCIE